MNRPRPFQQRLEAWLDEGPTAAPQDLLGDVLASVPNGIPRRRRLGAGRRLFVLSASAKFAATIAAVLVIGLVGFTLLNSNGPGIGGTGTGATPTLEPTLAPTPTAAATETAVVSPPVAPTVTLCGPDSLAARITSWDGAAGSRFADIELKNTGTVPCETKALDRPQLVGGNGAILIEGAPAAASDTLTLAPGETVTSLAAAGNYCLATPVAPVTVAFVLSSGAGRIVATPVSPTDTEGVPPCNGNPGDAGTIQMHPWAP